MARLNIEDDFWIDIIRVIAKFGDEDKAIGNAVRFFRFAQDKHKKNQVISEEEFVENGFSENLIPVFAKRTEEGIIAKGAGKHFDWLKERQEAGRTGGRKGGQQAKNRPRDAFGRLLPKANPKQTQSKSEQTKASYSYSFSKKEKEYIGQTSFDLESLYFLYPRKIKKKKGIEKLKAIIKTQEDFDLVKKSISNYSDYCRKTSTESKYIMHFTTFVNSWEDYIDPIVETKKVNLSNFREQDL